MSEVLRYLGIAKESVFGTKVAPQFFIDQSSSDLNSPDGAELIKPGGLGRVAREHAPGMYIPTGTIDFVADPPLLYYLLWILLGDKTTVDNTSTIPDEATPSDEGGDIDVTLANLPVVPNTVIIETSGAVQHGHDDGFGRIVLDAPGALTGTIDYATGVMKITGGDISEAYTTTYDEGTFEHTVVSDNLPVLPSATLKLGKDELMHTFVGCAFNNLTLAVEKEWATITLDVIGQKDEKETIISLASLDLPQGFPLPFHKMTMKAADHGSALADISAIVEGLSMSFANNGDGEGGVTLGSRYPRKIYGGDLEITADLTLSFENTNELEDFWGAATGPSADGTQEKVYQVFLDGGAIGDMTIDFHRTIMTGPPVISPSGRERITQSFSIQVLYDFVEAAAVSTVSNSVYNYS